MSRIGNRPVDVPSGVEVKLSNGVLDVKGPKGQLHQVMPPDIEVEIADDQVRFKRPNDKTKVRALHGLARALVGNMVQGVTVGFSRELEIHGVGYRADAKGNTLNLLLGLSHPVGAFRVT